MFDISEDAYTTVERAAMWQRRAVESESRVLMLAVDFAHEHPAIDSAAEIAVPGMEVLLPLAGEGTPAVAEFAPAELGAALGMTTRAATELIGEGLELAHRLPRCWRRVQSFDLPAWRARLIARETMSLSPEAADFVDAQVAPGAHRVTTHRMKKLVEAALLRVGVVAPELAPDARSVRLSPPGSDGLTYLSLTCDTPDALAFDRAVDRVATALGSLGDTDPRDARRAKAVGILADPQLMLDLRNGVVTPDLKCFRPPVYVELFVHLTADALEDGGVARVEDAGPVVSDAVRRWLGRTDFHVRPVLDLASGSSVDAYEVPTRMREAQHALSPYCVFPWCNRPSRACDMDHTQPYVSPDDGGPPGQTRPDNLGPLCRRHHRLKTFGDWHLEQPTKGQFDWTSPGGAHYRVDSTGTTRAPAPA